ncbi:MAG: LCP family protein [Eubacteriaceae bacterium]|nr:LCP family protein [Eubacteriaceae bacterium]
MKILLRKRRYRDEDGRLKTRTQIVFRKSEKNNRNRARTKRRRKGSFFRKLGLALVLVLVAAAALGAVAGTKAYHRVQAALDSLERIDIGTSREDLYISDEAYDALKGTNTVNIALFGKDVEDGGYQRSDSILILSINRSTGDMKLVSVQRDTFVPLPGFEDLYKINSGYFFGKDALEVKALNMNLDMNISKFVTIDMEAMCDLVDALGGVELTVNEEERLELNRLLDDINWRLGGTFSPYLEYAGTHLCDGRQALTYARMRYLGNSDFDRTARQRILMNKIFQKLMGAVSSKNVRILLRVMDAMGPHITTNFTNAEIYELMWTVLRGSKSLTAYSLCDEDYIKMGIVDDDMQVLVPWTLTDMAADLHRKLFGDSFVYSPSAQQRAASEAVEDYIYYYGVDLYDIDTGSTI